VKRLWSALICGAIVLTASLALGHLHPFGDAGLYAAKPGLARIASNAQVPPEVRAILDEKCADCHSDQPRVPLYGRIAPASWLMERDIIEARKAMNLSLWDSYSYDQQQTLIAKMVQETKSHEMPPVQYRMIHWNARIADGDAQAFSLWAHGSQATQADSGGGGEGDAALGKALFEKRCTGCHSLTQNHEGPRLQGVYGRTSGTVADFAYSPALKKARIVWNEEALEKWLADPDAFIAGNDMDFQVSKRQDRQDLIRFLKESAAR
jgi:cytochrome c